MSKSADGLQPACDGAAIRDGKRADFKCRL